jgi:hypothetical protein
MNVPRDDCLGVRKIRAASGGLKRARQARRRDTKTSPSNGVIFHDPRVKSLIPESAVDEMMVIFLNLRLAPDLRVLKAKDRESVSF